MEFPETGNMLKFYWPTDTTMLLEVYLNGELAYAKEYSAYDSAYEVLFDLPEDSVLWKELEQKLSKWQNFSKDFKF